MMRAAARLLFSSLGCLSLLLLAGPGTLFADDEIESKRVHFTTYDEVELSGTLYRSKPAAGNRDKDAVVLLLHDFDHSKGGGSKEDGWQKLAGELQKEGYAVLSFDFRGFGNSKTVSPQFWQHPINRGLRGARSAKPPASIDQKDFPRGYYLALINDVAAARAYLNTLNDSGEVNVSNLIVVGAGQGATLGALWMASECRRQRDPRSDRWILNMGPQNQWGPLSKFDDPEGNDLAAAVWLTISPSLEGRPVGKALTSSLVDTGRTAKIPMYFLYASDDPEGAKVAEYNVKAISTENGKEIEIKGIKKQTIPNSRDLRGSKLVAGRGLRTLDYTIKYLNRTLEDRGSRVKRAHDDQKFAFCWSMPWPTARNVRRIPAKLPGESVPHIIPPEVVGLR